MAKDCDFVRMCCGAMFTLIMGASQLLAQSAHPFGEPVTSPVFSLLSKYVNNIHVSAVPLTNKNKYKMSIEAANMESTKRANRPTSNCINYL